jgi:hypothetical protein
LRPCARNPSLNVVDIPGDYTGDSFNEAGALSFITNTVFLNAIYFVGEFLTIQKFLGKDTHCVPENGRLLSLWQYGERIDLYRNLLKTSCWCIGMVCIV